MSDEAMPAGATPDPAECAREGARGNPVEIAGREWLLADYVPRLTPVWDKLFDDSMFGRGYEPGDVALAAGYLLAENYRLAPAEAFDVVLAADWESLVAPAVEAMFGPPREKYRSSRTYGQWVRLSLRANGIDPDSVPPEERRPLVAYLVAAGKALPASRWVGSAAAVARRMKQDAE